MINIGIIGNGFVGSAVAHGFSLWATVRIYDTDSRLTTHTFEEVAAESDVVFVCVPTPTNLKTHTIDLSILNSVIEDLSESISARAIVVIKSTVIPGTTQGYSRQYPKMRFVSNPEFLSERTAKNDFNNPARIVVGGDHEHREVVSMLYRERFPHVPIVETDSKTAEFIKYACNCFFAVKISVLNEFYQMAEKQNLDWNAIMRGMLTSGWINPMHTMVPGTDGHLGFGGKCFPKDLNAFINFFNDAGVHPTMLQAAWEKNNEVRGTKDWEKIKGAVSLPTQDEVSKRDNIKRSKDGK